MFERQKNEITKEYISYLKSEIEWLKSQVEREKKRADLATDALLAIKANSQPIMPEKYNLNYNEKEFAANKAMYEHIKNELELVGKDTGEENNLENENLK